jgi:hypothetical protein
VERAQQAVICGQQAAAAVLVVQGLETQTIVPAGTAARVFHPQLLAPQ